MMPLDQVCGAARSMHIERQKLAVTLASIRRGIDGAQAHDGTTTPTIPEVVTAGADSTGIDPSGSAKYGADPTMLRDTQRFREALRPEARYVKRLVFALALLWMSGVSLAEAWINVWTSNGPTFLTGALTILSIAIDPTTNPPTLYAATNGTFVFRSTNLGRSWSALNTSPPSATALAIAPTTPTTLYAAEGRGGMFKSTDGGASWSAAGLSSVDSIVALAIDTNNPRTLYAGQHSFAGGVFKSTDEGGSWDAVLTNKDVMALAIHPTTPTTLYAGPLSG